MDLKLHPDKWLKKSCRSVKASDYKKLLQVVLDMNEILFKSYTNEVVGSVKGLGLAANQVGCNLRVFIMSPKHDPKDVEVVINPRIIRHGREIEEQTECCLSYPKVVNSVKRWCVMEVEYLNMKQDTITKRLDRKMSRLFQHEYDHLLGIGCMEKTGDPVCDRADCQICRKGKI